MAQQTYGEWMRSNPPIPNLTAVEWYYHQTVIEGKTNYYELLEQAKQIEKEQMGKAVSTGISKADMTNNRGYFDFEQYYNETYGEKIE